MEYTNYIELTAANDPSPDVIHTVNTLGEPVELLLSDIRQVFPEGEHAEDFFDEGQEISDITYLGIATQTYTPYAFGVDETDPSLWELLLNFIQPT